MTQLIVKKSSLQGEMTVPASKSHTMRAILFGALGSGQSIIRQFLPSPDTQAMINACRLFGAQIEVSSDQIAIEGLKGQVQGAADVIHAGNSGIILRFCSALGALASRPIVVTGDHSIRHQRPMQTLLDGLSQLGVKTASMRNDGFAPVIIQGPIKSSKAIIDGQDSQFVSALLIALAFAEQPIELIVENPGEKPWVALTLDWFNRLGIRCENRAFEEFRLEGRANYPGFEYAVPGDFSSAAFPIAAALVTQSELTLKNLDMQDAQGDKKLIPILKQMGALIDYDECHKTLKVKKGGKLCGIDADINDYIDAVTILAVLACFAEGETRLLNAAGAKQKECNRLQCIAAELSKMGADIRETGDGLIIRKSLLKGVHVQSHQDHRMAMSLAVAGLGAHGETTIDGAECISKTFPDFLTDFQGLGANIREFNGQ